MVVAVNLLLHWHPASSVVINLLLYTMVTVNQLLVGLFS